MPKKKKPDSNSENKFHFKGFINVEFNDPEKEDFRNWMKGKAVDMISSMIEKSEEGWKCSFGYDAWNDAYTFALTGKKTGTRYDGYCLMVRHRDDGMLQLLAHYLCHHIVVDETEPLPDVQNDLDWG